MPHLSAFSPCGGLELSGAPPIARQVYEQLTSALCDWYDISPGTRAEAWCYATARGLARVAATLRRAKNQASASKLTELLPRREWEFGLIPGPRDDLPTRRRATAAAALRNNGASLGNVTAALRALLGDAFVAYLPTAYADAVVYPPNPSASNELLLSFVPTAPKTFIIDSPIVNVGTETWFLWHRADTSAPMPAAGDVVMVDGETSQRERVTLTNVYPGDGLASATFGKAHEAGAVASTMPFPFWWSTARYNVVVVKDSAAIDPETRRKTHELLGKILRGVSTWAIVAETGHAGGFVLADDSDPLSPPGVWPADGASLMAVTQLTD